MRSEGSTGEEVPVWTENVSVVRAYSELALSRTVAERVAVLERLYRDGWEDAVQVVDEEANRAAEEGEGCGPGRERVRYFLRSSLPDGGNPSSSRL